MRRTQGFGALAVLAGAMLASTSPAVAATAPGSPITRPEPLTTQVHVTLNPVSGGTELRADVLNDTFTATLPDIKPSLFDGRSTIRRSSALFETTEVKYTSRGSYLELDFCLGQVCVASLYVDGAPAIGPGEVFGAWSGASRGRS